MRFYYLIGWGVPAFITGVNLELKNPLYKGKPLHPACVLSGITRILNLYNVFRDSGSGNEEKNQTRLKHNHKEVEKQIIFLK